MSQTAFRDHLRLIFRRSPSVILSLLCILSYGTSQSQLLQVNTRSASPSMAGLGFTLSTIDRFNPRNPHCKALGDINGDGFLDVLAASSSNYTEGLFWYQYPSWTKTRITTGSFSTSMAVGDVDGDGDLDAIMGKGDYYGYSIWWYENPRPTGNPSTSLWTEHYIGDAALHDVVVGDVTKDGKLDIIVRAGNATTLFAQVSPTSWTKKIVSTRPFEGTALGDIDRDGDLDLVITGYWLENPLPAGSPLTSTWTERTIVSSWPDKASAQIADINQDGKLDVLFGPSETANGKLSWFESANPRTDTWVEHVVDPSVSYLHTLLAGDIDKNGTTDVIMAEMHQSSAKRVGAYLNTGTGLTWNYHPIGTSGSHNGSLGDVDADGDLDLIGANWENTNSNGAPILMWENRLINNTRALDSWQRFVIDGSRPWQSIFVTSADIDRDGKKDIISGGWWYKNPGSASGTWNRSVIGSPLNNVAIAFDFDNNGTVDILGTQGVGANSNAQFVWARNDSLGRFTVLNNISSGDGDFLQGVDAARFNTVANDPLRIALSWHMAGKGIQMLTVPEDASNGNWSWSRVSTTSQDEQLSATDVDRDGLVDLVMGTKWQKNNTGSWSPYSLYDPPGDPDRNRVGDINQDGRIDVVVGYEAINILGRLAWYEQPGTATGFWTQHIISDSVVGPMSLDLADMDHDGDLDVIVGEHNYAAPQTARLIVFENVDGSGTSWLKHIVWTGDEHHDGAHVVDIDNDGDLDIVSIGWENYKTILYENKSNVGGGANGPAITSHPTNQTVDQGQAATFSVVATGSQPLTYQWLKNDSPISGATASSYSITTTPGDNGSSFKCVVSNSYGTVTSNPAVLTVTIFVPNITTHPVNQSVREGFAATFSVSAGGGLPLSYQWTRNGSPITGATSSSYTTANATKRDNGSSFRCIVTNSFGSATSNIATLNVLPSRAARVTEALQALYTFQEGGGSVVNDVSGVGTPLNLVIGNTSNVTWQQGCLSVNANTIVASTGAASKIVDACKQSSEITAEAWVIPASPNQSGPARIITISADVSNRDFTIGQGVTGGSTSALEIRRRTSNTTSNGTPSLTTPAGSFTTELVHLVTTRSSNGTTKVYLNGVETSSENTGGSFANWSSYRLALANELTNDRPWLGKYYLVAVYSRALTAAEIQQNFQAGPTVASGSYVNSRIFLEGPYNAPGDTMQTSLQAVMPLTQPFNVAPWNYSGGERVSGSVSSIVDWVLVELRTGTAANTKIATRAGLLKSNGVIVDTDGFSPMWFSGVADGSYYVVIRHRNHLAAMSTQAATIDQTGTLYDFSTSATSAFGASPLTQLKNGVFGMIAGDSNGSSIVTSADANAVFGSLNQTGYFMNDANLSGIVTSADANVVFGNMNKASQVP